MIHLLGGTPLPWRPLITRGALLAPLALTRAQADGARSVAAAVDGTTRVEYAADAPRFDGMARRLLIEGQRTNMVANPRTPGGDAWTRSNVTNPVLITGPDGVPGSASRLTDGVATNQHILFAAFASFTAGASYAQSAILRAGTCRFAQIIGSGGAFGVDVWANFDLVAGVVGAVGSAVTRSSIRDIGGGWYWCEVVGPAAATASVAACIVGFATAIDAPRNPTFAGDNRSLDVFWCWTEAGAFSSTPILPPVSTPGASTRGADLVSAPLASLGIGGNGAFTVLWSGVIPQAAPAGLNQSIIELDTGSVANRFLLRNDNGGSNVTLYRVTAGAAASAALGAMVAGTPFRLGVAFNGAGRAAGTLNGAAPGVVTGGPSSGLTTLRQGSSALGTEAMSGETGALLVLPYTLSDAALAARVAAMPL